MAGSSDRPVVCVVGACNMDLVSFVPRLPRMGETLHGSRFHMGFGGKGANQAVMAARLGADVSMIAELGQDIFGRDTLENFESVGIDTTHVHFTDEASTGVAPIAVDPDGENSIIIVMGANDLLTEEEIEAARAEIAAADVLVCQLEIPVEISLKALRVAREEGVATVFNPAPAREDLPEEFYGLSTVFCPNESETELLTGMPVGAPEEDEAAARELLDRGAEAVILTLGDRGSLIVTPDSARQVPTEKVEAVDSTGAGDAFVGSLAYFMGLDMPLEDAVRRANAIAARSVQKDGTQTSFPDREEVADLLA